MPPNKGMELTNGARTRMEAPFAAHPQCWADRAGASEDAADGWAEDRRARDRRSGVGTGHVGERSPA